MRILTKHVLKGVAKAFIPAFVGLTLIMVLGFCVQLLHGGLDVVRLYALLPPILKHSIPVVLPASFLTAVIVAFGRLSADNEITAMRAAGVHILRVILPVCAVALLLSGVATYFQFEVVPQARKEIKLLEYKAIKQILIDRVALSARRQFSFADVVLRYEDFRDGKMIDLKLLEIPGGIVKNLVVAARGSIRPDPGRDNFLLFTLEDCRITPFTDEGLSGRGSLKSQEFVLELELPQNVGDIESNVRYLRTLPLLNFEKELESEVRTHPERFDKAGRRGQELSNQIKELTTDVEMFEDRLRERRRKLARLKTESAARLQHRIESSKAEIENARKELESFNNQKDLLRNEFNALNEKPEKNEEDFERLSELPRLQQQIEANVQGRNEKIKSARAAIGKAQEDLANNQKQMASLRAEIADAEALKEQTAEERRKLVQEKKRADTQKTLRSLQVRIHKRLTQAAAVFIFSLIGIPLGIMTRRGSLMLAFGISFALVLLVFYPFLVVGQIMAESGMLAPAPSMWAGNGLTFLIGLCLMTHIVRQ